MKFRLLVVAAIAAAALIAIPAVVSQASKRKKHDVDLTILAATVKSNGSKSIDAAYSTGKPYGKSAVIFNNTVGTAVNGKTPIATKFTLSNKKGSVSGTGDATATPTTGGNVDFTGDAKVKSGTGKYEDAKGSVDITGSYDSSTGVLTLHATGTVKY